MMYTMLYMPATRTQIYLTADQRDRLDERGAQTGLGLAEMIRRAVDEYLGEPGDIAAALDETFGALTELELPSRG
jgi:ribbon-helix-helix CopG family protein